MEFDSDNVAEIEKYAFLLGSAIKNEDTEQFFSIYDSIIPKDLPDNQLEDIKDRARKVVDLPDGEFNSLVLKARHFSLAPTGSAMSCRRESPGKRWTQPSKEEESEEDDGKFNYCGAPGGRFDSSSLLSTMKTSARSSESDTRKFDDDSGVCNSSKATNSIGSLSDHDGSDDEGRGVSFDYYPPQIKIRSGCGLNLDYDEAHEVKSDHSSQDVNSPRSDFSEGIEMTTFNSRETADDDDDEFNFRREVNYQDDFNTSGESEDENSYRHKYYNMGYRPLSRDVPTFQPTFESLGSSSLSSREVDRGINFPSLKEGTSQYSRYSSYQNPQFSSERVKIEKTSYKRDKADPPFGRGPEQLDRVASSIGSLISQVPSDEVKNMPEGRKLEPLQREDPKRKKKKKKSAKDDASAATDENGNPIETRGLNPVQYKQMRESPSSGGGTVANQQYESYGTFPLEHLAARPYTNTNKETENDIASKALRRRKKKQEKLDQQQKKAEDIENYKGDKPLEELLSFIGGQNDSNKKAKKNSNVVEEIPSKTQKSNKKNKDKKQKSPIASSSVEEVEVKGSNSAQPADLDIQGGEDNMGNSSGKSEVEIVENGDVEGIYSKSDKIAKSPLKQNDKIDVTKHVIYAKNDKIKDVICRESVKEKEPSATNNKRDIVTGSGTENNKKKSDKSAKASKSDKAEMPTTKSEDSLKLEASLPNNVTVKQKNAKNKKNKLLSPAVKVDNELPAADLNHQPVLAGFPTAESLVDDQFIFTDLEVPEVPKEDEFQVVGKKKKKVTKEISQQNHFVTNNGYIKPGRRHEEKRQVPLHSSNKASVPIVAPMSMVEGNTRLRDLSPSAFPALTSGKGRQSVQEGRRNSTGDVPIPSGLKSQDDSDLESVKSLPATQGSQAVDSILSPRLSYAKMAAGPKVPDSSSSSEKRSSLDSEDSEHDHKMSVWKGSPTERRHSIGSSPEVVNKVAGVQASAATATVKAGSQEHIVADVVVNLEKEVAVNANTVTAWGGANSEVKNLEEGICVLNKENASPSEANRTVKISPVQTKSSISPNKSADNAVKAYSVGNSQQVETGKQLQLCNSEPETNSTFSVNKNSIVTNSNVHKHETSKSKTCSNGSNGKKQKSVIFLDNRVEETPENLGISFGFEIDNLVKPGKSDSDDSVKINKSEQGMQKSECNVESENVQFVDFIYSNDSKSDPKDSSVVVVTDDIVSSTSSNSSVISNHNSNTGKANSSCSNNEIVDPVKTIVRMNGIIPPQGHSSNLSKEVKENVSVTTGGSGEQVETEQAIPDTTEDKVCVYYGESVVTLKKDIVVPSLKNGPTSYCGLVHFIQETELRSNFNVAEAAVFLTKEWDRTVQMQDKEPHSVKVHQD
ncbi:uncharacterized protein LOC123533550 [Mercenaria mercenaria]|uniref:uncharacterized protein LOC123533550 n=1 Tax=Mercenaria mercenaria TaxID=6596 RepID=UPI00234F847D|nr:uncharacterized protein LOC123533550 [Mercenaria mercenaria]